MKRVIFAGLVALSGAACGEEQSVPREVSSRVNTVAVARNPHEVEAFCDVRFSANDASRRAATGPYAQMPASDRWRWVNVWATWCRPCVEELPLVAEWTRRFAEHGSPIETKFLSVDASDDVVTAYAAQRPEVRGSARLSSPQELPALFSSLGLDPGATIPVHAFYDPSGQLRCVRTGSVHEGDYEILKRIMRGE